MYLLGQSGELLGVEALQAVFGSYTELPVF